MLLLLAVLFKSVFRKCEVALSAEIEGSDTSDCKVLPIFIMLYKNWRVVGNGSKGILVVLDKPIDFGLCHGDSKMICRKYEQADKAAVRGKPYHNHKKAHRVCKRVCLPSFFEASLDYQG